MDVQAKRLKTAHRVSATFFPNTHTHAKTRRKKATLLELASIFMAPRPPSPFKENTAEVSECQRARICFTFPKCHGIWAACTNEKQRGVEAGRESTWVKHGRWQGVFSTRWLITVFMPLRCGLSYQRMERPLTHTHTHLWVAALWAEV